MKRTILVLALSVCPVVASSQLSLPELSAGPTGESSWALRFGRAFVEGGIGGAIFYRNFVERHDLGAPVNFEDRIGLGVRLRRHELLLRAIHYSNAGFAPPNQGAEAFSLQYSVVL